MDFITIDIAYMPKDTCGYQYFLLIGDMFSKFIQTVSLRDQEAPTISKALESSWFYVHGIPRYLLSDQGSNVDGEVMQTLCKEYGIEKRRSSAYHSQGNGFAERNIRNVKEMLRCVLLDRKLSPSKWRQVLPELVFALNCSMSSAIKCLPYKVVFGRDPVLPIDVYLGLKRSGCDDNVTPRDYSDETNMALQDTFEHVVRFLKLSKITMQKQYNKRLNVFDHKPGEKVWMTTKYFKTGESRKLSPRRSGPWTIIEKLPNGVNFRVRCDSTKEEKVVHHDRLSPVKGRGEMKQKVVPSHRNRRTRTPPRNEDVDLSDFTTDPSSSEDEGSDYEPSSSDSASSAEGERRYPVRNRQQRVIPGAVLWNLVDCLSPYWKGEM